MYVYKRAKAHATGPSSRARHSYDEAGRGSYACPPAARPDLNAHASRIKTTHKRGNEQARHRHACAGRSDVRVEPGESRSACCLSLFFLVMVGSRTVRFEPVPRYSVSDSDRYHKGQPRGSLQRFTQERGKRGAAPGSGKFRVHANANRSHARSSFTPNERPTLTPQGTRSSKRPTLAMQGHTLIKAAPGHTLV